MTNPRGAYQDEERYQLERRLAPRFYASLRRAGWKNTYINQGVPTRESVLWAHPAGLIIPYPILLLWFLYLVNAQELEPVEYCHTCWRPR
jgi:hypothetical protein